MSSAPLVFNVQNRDGSKIFTVLAHSYEELCSKAKASGKLDIRGPVFIVLRADGAAIDEESYHKFDVNSTFPHLVVLPKPTNGPLPDARDLNINLPNELNGSKRGNIDEEACGNYKKVNEKIAVSLKIYKLKLEVYEKGDGSFLKTLPDRIFINGKSLAKYAAEYCTYETLVYLWNNVLLRVRMAYRNYRLSDSLIKEFFQCLHIYISSCAALVYSKWFTGPAVDGIWRGILYNQKMLLESVPQFAMSGLVEAFFQFLKSCYRIPEFVINIQITLCSFISGILASIASWLSENWTMVAAAAGVALVAGGYAVGGVGGAVAALVGGAAVTAAVVTSRYDKLKMH